MYSRYNIYLDNFPREKYTTIYNLFSKKAICVKTESLQEKCSERISDTLIENEMIIEDEKTEIQNVLSFYDMAVNESDELNVILLLTTKCNCKCVYCYEDGNILDNSGCLELEKAYSFIFQKVKEKNIKKLNIVYYGGEPLLNKEIIYILSKKIFEETDIAFNFDIVTNGTLLHVEDVEEWLKLGLRRIKVTIDGNEKCHNQRRPLINGENAYVLIINNLIEISHRVDVLINIVVDRDNYGVETMIEELIRKGVRAKYSISIREPDYYNESEKNDIILKYARILAEKGVYQYSKMGGNHGTVCSGKKKNSYVIGAGNQIYYCNGNFQHTLGNVISNHEKEDYCLKDKCRKCTFLPICYGDCRFEARCQKKYFETVIPELLKIYLSEK